MSLTTGSVDARSGRGGATWSGRHVSTGSIDPLGVATL
jgi:hypothetical protein